MTTKELLVKLNELRQVAGKAPLSAWKQSRQKLEEAIEALTAEAPQEVIEEVQEAPEVVEAETEERITEETTETVEVKAPRGAIGAMSIQLLSETDLPYLEIVAKIKEAYPSAKTTPRSLASVAMDLRKDGIEVPSRRKPAKSKLATEAQVEA